jgi:hypothetical protein
MASFSAATFDEIITAGLPRASVETEPVIRRLASGGEHVSAGPTTTHISIEALCDADALGALRSALAAGDVDTLVLDGETVDDQQLTAIGAPIAQYNCDLWRVPLTFTQASQVITPRIGVNLNGVGVSGVISVSTSVGRNVRFATATVTCTAPHGSRGQSVEIYGGADAGVVALFKGTLEAISRDYFPGAAVLSCSGTLKRLQRPWPDYADYTGQDDAAMIVNLIEKRDGLHSIESTGWTLGQKRPVQVQPGDSFIQWVDALDEVCRMRTYDRHDGAVYRRRDDWVAVGAVTATLEEGVRILSIRRNNNYDAIRNWITARGIAHDGLHIISSVAATSSELDALMPETAPNYNEHVIQSDLIEVIEHVEGVAAINLYDLNRAQVSLEITVPFDPTLVVDETIHVIAPSIGVDAVCMIWDVKHEVDGEGGTTTLTTNRGTL